MASPIRVTQDVGGAVDFYELKQAVGIITQLGSRALAEVAPVVADALVTEVLEVFDKEGAVAGRPKWPGFWWQRQGLPMPGTRSPKPKKRGKTVRRGKSSTKSKGKRRKPSKAARRFKGGNAKLLQDTGNLAGSITPDSDDESATAFTNVPYARYHVSRAPRKKIPLRDFFDIDQESFTREVADMILRQLDRPRAA
jgi:phage gpG-like protein